MSPSSGAITRPSCQVSSGKAGVLLVGLAVEHPLVGPQQVERGEDHAGGGDHGPPAAGEERTDQDQELAGEAVEAGQTDRAQHHDGEHGGEDRRRLLEALEGGDLPGVAAVVDHPDEEEERAGGDAVVHHLQHAALDALRGEGEGAEHDEAEVGDRRVGDEALQVLLHGGDDGAVEDADHAEGDERRARRTRRPLGTGRARSARSRRCRASASRRPGSPTPRWVPGCGRRAARCAAGTAAP